MNKKNNSVLLIAVLLFLQTTLSAQGNLKVNYWVAFKDKNNSPFSLSSPTVFLSSKSLARRNAQQIPLHISDLPVNPAYIRALDTIYHVDVVYASKWLNGALVKIDSASVATVALNKIKSFAFVLDTARVKKMRLLTDTGEFNANPHARSFNHGYTGENFNYGRSKWQAHQLDADCLHSLGFRGQGMTIAVMDVGFNSVDSSPVFDSLRNNNGILGGYDFVSGSTNPFQGGGHGTNVLSCLAANKPGELIGTAPLAKYWLFRTEDGGSETITEEYNWIRAAEFADSVGVDMITTSLGYAGYDIPSQSHTYASLNGRTAPMSKAATIAARKGIFVLNAAGNEGDKSWKYILVPADADSICAVGAVDTAGVYAAFSSQGPTSDGRIKPDLMATGAGAWICAPSSVCFPGNGTSFATPVLAGAVACFWQQNKHLSNIQLLNELKKRGSRAQNPDNQMGWGIPKLADCALKDLPFDYTVYYNASKKQIVFKLTQTNYDFVEIKVYDLHGRLLVSTGKVYGQVFTIPFYAEVLSNSVYITSVETNKGSKIKKFLR